MNIRVAQTAKHKDRGWWHWSVWLEGSDEDLDRIDFVEYILHETFSEPVRRSTDRTDKFRLNSSGWGEFKIHIRAHLKDGKTMRYEHWLLLREEAAQAEDISTAEQPDSTDRIDVFLSCALVDMRLAEKLTAALKDRLVRARMISDLDPDMSPEKALFREADRLKGAIFIISEVSSPDIIAEAETLKRSNVKLLPVLVGSRAKVPKVLADSEPLQLKDFADVDAIAGSVLQHLGYPQR